MIGWMVYIRYFKKGVLNQEIKYVYVRSADSDINIIEKRIKQILDATYSVVVYIEKCDNTEDAIAANIWEDKAYIYGKGEDATSVTAEKAVKFLHEVFLQMKKQAEEMFKVGCV